MKILFCKISGMKYYKGACEEDKPTYGGSFVEKYGYGHEEYNFYPFELEDSGERECIGFVEPKSHNGKRNTLHIEKIEGCEDLAKADFAEGVLVVWCATRDKGGKTDVTVVGWYKNATVWRELQDWVLPFEDFPDERCYNVCARAEDCVLLPDTERNEYIWEIPTAKYTKAYGFGQSMVWYPDEPKAQPFVERLVNNINKYRGKNFLDVYPSEA